MAGRTNWNSPPANFNRFVIGEGGPPSLQPMEDVQSYFCEREQRREHPVRGGVVEKDDVDGDDEGRQVALVILDGPFDIGLPGRLLGCRSGFRVAQTRTPVAPSARAAWRRTQPSSMMG